MNGISTAHSAMPCCSRCCNNSANRHSGTQNSIVTAAQAGILLLRLRASQAIINHSSPIAIAMSTRKGQRIAPVVGGAATRQAAHAEKREPQRQEHVSHVKFLQRHTRL